MDIEGYVRKCLEQSKTEEEIVQKLSHIIRFHKRIDDEKSEKLAQAVIQETKITQQLNDEILKCPETGVHMGDFGVGSRGEGDFYVHAQIAKIIKNTNADSIVNPTAQDDGGVVEINGDANYVTTAIDGIHSRLSDYPFLAGFHTARATLRDVCVMGADPVALISDIHLADDGDVAKLLDFTAGICAVSELTEVPLVSGSTLRIGGDMVLGDRLVGAVGAVGTSNEKATARSQAREGDCIIMTEGSGGGTITTTAIYNNRPEVIRQTLNVKFIEASRILNSITGIHAMTDITNGGIKGDVNEINRTTGLGIHLIGQEIVRLVNPVVYAMLEDLNIDCMSVSIDALMIIAPPEKYPVIREALDDSGIECAIVGYVNDTGRVTIEDADGKVSNFSPKFREAAYTPVKKVVEDLYDIDIEESKKAIDTATAESIRKKDEIVRWIRKSYE